MNEQDEPTLATSIDSPALKRKKARFGRGAVWIGVAVALAAFAFYIAIGIYGGYYAVG